MPGKKFVHRLLVPGTDLFQQAGGLGGIVGHHDLLGKG
jgi:hypothetical protein